MSAFLARNRLIVLAYAGMVVLLLVTALFSPGFLSVSNMRSTVVLAAFVGIVALGQTFVIIGGGIDLSVPWVLNSAAIVMALLCGGQDLPLVWVMPLLLAGGAFNGLINGVGVAQFGVPPIIMTLATNVILQGLILVLTGGSPTKRYALPHSKILIHQPWVSQIGGQATDVEIAARDLIATRHTIARIYEKSTNKPVDQILKDIDRDYYMTSEEAKDYGIIDHVIEDRGALPQPA